MRSTIAPASGGECRGAGRRCGTLLGGATGDKFSDGIAKGEPEAASRSEISVRAAMAGPANITESHGDWLTGACCDGACR